MVNMEMPRLSQGGHKVVTRWSHCHKVASSLYKIPRVLALSQGCMVAVNYHNFNMLDQGSVGICIALLLGQHPNAPNGCQGGGLCLPSLHHFHPTPLTFLSFTLY